jgi:ABC-type Mn2+/Zn2+ transport system permease subunit
LNLVVLLMVAATAVVGVRVVGVILTVAVLVVPAATALHWTHELRPAMVLAGAIGSAAGIIGLYVAYYLPVAPAAVMVVVLSSTFAGSLVAEHLRTGRRQSAATRIVREEVA